VEEAKVQQLSLRPSSSEILFLCKLPESDMQKVSTLIDAARDIIYEYFEARTTFDIIICYGPWDMEVQIVSRIHNFSSGQYYNVKSPGITDYHLKEIVFRYDTARFGHYLHELIHGVLSSRHPHQMREGLAWYFTLLLTETKRYLQPYYPRMIDDLYIFPIRKMARVMGPEFIKDFAVGRATVLEDSFSQDIKDLFLPEEVFYAKKRYFR
jgi:hypothetical protein